jgi:hypothetical protein
MRLRALFVIALWTALIAGAVHLVDGQSAHSQMTIAIVGGGMLAARALVVVRVRWRRVRSWPRPGEPDVYPPGPRRVLLTQTGLAGPQ